MIKCDGRWFGRKDLTVVWAEDRDELAEMLERMGRETVCIGSDYTIMVHEASGREMAIPNPEGLTPRQRGVVLELVEAGLKETFAA